MKTLSALVCGTLAALSCRSIVGHAQGNAANPLPVDVLVLAYAPGTKQFTTVRIPANSSAALGAPDAEMLSLEPITSEVGQLAMFRSCAVGQAAAADLARVASELKAVEFLDTEPAKKRIGATMALVRLRMEQRADERRTERNDPLRLELRRQQERHVPQWQKDVWDRQEAFRSLGSDITAQAFAWADVNHVKLRILHDQLRSFEPIVTQARLALQIRIQDAENIGREVAGWQGYSSAVALALDASVGRVADVPMTIGRAARSCDGPSPGWDWIEVEGPDRPNFSALIGEVTFDKGGKQMTTFRRMGETTRWAGRIDWPADGATAKLRLRWPGTTRWYETKANLRADRPSMAAQVADGRRAVKQIEKNLKETNFRAAGADVRKTAPVF